MPVGKRESMHWEAAKGISLCFPTAHGPLVTDISLLRTPLLSKPHVDPCITSHYDILEVNMTLQGFESWQ